MARNFRYCQEFIYKPCFAAAYYNDYELLVLYRQYIHTYASKIVLPWKPTAVATLALSLWQRATTRDVGRYRSLSGHCSRPVATVKLLVYYTYIHVLGVDLTLYMTLYRWFCMYMYVCIKTYCMYALLVYVWKLLGHVLKVKVIRVDLTLYIHRLYCIYMTLYVWKCIQSCIYLQTCVCLEHVLEHVLELKVFRVDLILYIQTDTSLMIMERSLKIVLLIIIIV